MYVSPRSAIRLMFGVSIIPPNASIAEKPTSSRTMRSTFAAPSGAVGCLYGSQSGIDSLMSTLITPLNFLLMATSRLKTAYEATAWAPRRLHPVRMSANTAESAGDRLAVKHRATSTPATTSSSRATSSATSMRSTFISTSDGEPGLNYLCAGYKEFFHHVDRPMRFISEQLLHGSAPAQIMQLYANEDAARGRNDPCKCGSGRKWKHCHGHDPITV